jgi:hypothetical protein
MLPTPLAVVATGDILFNGKKLTKPVKRKMGFVTQVSWCQGNDALVLVATALPQSMALRGCANRMTCCSVS